MVIKFDVLTEWRYDRVMKKNIYAQPVKVKTRFVRGVRRGKIKYVCKDCNKWFQINRTHKEQIDKQLVLQHLHGIAFRSLAYQKFLRIFRIFLIVQISLVNTVIDSVGYFFSSTFSKKSLRFSYPFEAIQVTVSWTVCGV